MSERSAEDQRLRTLHAMRQMGLDVQNVWLYYFSIGGKIDEFELDAYLHGLIPLRTFDRNVIAHAVNEMISDIPRPAAPYDNEIVGDL